MGWDGVGGVQGLHYVVVCLAVFFCLFFLIENPLYEKEVHENN